MVTAGRPHYGRLADMDYEQIRSALDERLMQTIEVTRNAAGKVRPGGTLVFMSAIEGRRPGAGLTIVSAVTAAMSALIASLALEFAPLRVNQIAAGFIDSPCLRRCSAMRSKTAAISSAPRSRSAAWSSPPTSPRSPCTS